MANFPSMKPLPGVLELKRLPTKHVSTKKPRKVHSIALLWPYSKAVLNLAPCSRTGTETVFQSGAGVLPSAVGNLFQFCERS